MKWHRINALLIRHLYLYKRSVPRLMDIFYWPIMDLLLWGFLSRYLDKVNTTGVNIISILLGAIIFWELLNQSQRAVSIAFLEDIWEKNLLNIFVTPLRISEFLASTILIGLVRIAMILGVMGILGFFLYHYDIFMLGISLLPFIANLLLFGWALGLFTTAIILRYGTSAQVLAFGFIFLIQPFSAVFYPVSALPHSIQWISYLLPSTYVFEGMRNVLATGTIPFEYIGYGLLSNLIYLALILFFFYKMFAWVKVKGLLLKLD